MLETYFPCNRDDPSLLLIEPERLGYSERATQLHASDFCVTWASNPRDVYLMRNVYAFTVAVLNDTVGPPALHASAQIVRRLWPKARILILGKVPSWFEDHLYDAAVDHASTASTLLAALPKITIEPDNQESSALTAWLSTVSVSQARQAIKESDPRKFSNPVREADYARDRPELLRHVVR